MKIKILVVPALAVLNLVLIIGFIKPDYDTLSAKRQELSEKRAEAADVESVISNIDSLNTALDSDKQTEDFITRYFPKEIDQGRIIDAFNYLANQSGLVIIGVDVNEAVKELDGTTDPNSAADINAASSIPLPDGSQPIIVPSYVSPTPKSYAAMVTAQGSYENIKAFLEKLSRIDRIHSLALFSVSVNDKTLQSGEAAPDDQLIVTFKANFPYLVPQKVSDALQVPVFKEGSLKLDVANATQEAISGNVPDLNQGQSGKANPFQ